MDQGQATLEALLGHWIECEACGRIVSWWVNGSREIVCGPSGHVIATFYDSVPD